MNRRHILRSGSLAGFGLFAANTFSTALGQTRVPGANGKIRIGIVGFSDRLKSALLPALMPQADEFNVEITPKGGLSDKEAAEMKTKPNLLETSKLAGNGPAVTAANTGSDPMTSAHMRNWLECLRSRKPTHAPVLAGYQHAIACIMANAAARTGQRVTFDETTQEVMAGGKVFHL